MNAAEARQRSEANAPRVAEEKRLRPSQEKNQYLQQRLEVIHKAIEYASSRAERSILVDTRYNDEKDMIMSALRIDGYKVLISERPVPTYQDHCADGRGGWKTVWKYAYDIRW